MRNTLGLTVLVGSLGFLVVTGSCGKKKKADDTPDKVSSTPAQTGSLAVTYPSGLSISAFPKANGGNISIRLVTHEENAAWTLIPRGFFVPQGNPQKGTTVWRQCFKQANDGTYPIDTAATPGAQGYNVVEAAADGISAPDLGAALATVGDFYP